MGRSDRFNRCMGASGPAGGMRWSKAHLDGIATIAGSVVSKLIMLHNGHEQQRTVRTR